MSRTLCRRILSKRIMSDSVTYIILTLLLSAFFSAAEIAFVSANKLIFHLEQKEKGFIAKLIRFFYNHSNSLLASILIGNCIALVLYGIQMARLIDPFLSAFIPSTMVVMLIQTVFATFIILVCGEFIPKTIARILPNGSLSLFAIPLFLFYIVLYPVSQFTSFISRMMLKSFGIRLTSDTERNTIGREDLDYFIQQSIEEQSVRGGESEQEVRFFQNVLDFSHVRLRDCMVPRTEVVALNLNADTNQLIEKFVETGLSKIVIYDEDIDHIAGYIHSSEMFSRPTDWKTSIISLPHVPENMAANKLLHNMLDQKKSMAVVVDEFGGTAGIVTVEDLVEEIFGDIEDEHDPTSLVSRTISDSEYVFSGRMEIDKINEQFDLKIPESDEYVTISGFILNRYQSFPKVNETLEIDRFTIKILKVTSTKIELVNIKLNN